MNYEELMKKAKEFGFTHTGELNCSTIELMPEVRSMCASGKCAKYDTNWACPPACGTIEECSGRVHKFKKGLLVQTTGELEDALDGETMMETEAKHKDNFMKFRAYLEELYPGLLPLGAGCCQQCKTCTYPDAPCRFPHKAISSMEAYGMLITQVCQKNNIPYYYGDCTITYTSCYLLK